jgi:biotin carboxyl carrier protein
MDDGRSTIDELDPKGLEGIASMNVDVLVNGRPWKVAVEPAEKVGTFTITIKGKSRVVDALWIDADTLSLIDAGTAREIRLHPRDKSAVGVEFGGKVYEAVVVPPEARLKSRPTVNGVSAVASVGLGLSQAIKAPMPGRVVRVLVAVGDHVIAKQPVVVVEAMKMENELRTPRDGVVKEVLAIAGAAVDSGAVLVVIE